MTRKDYELIAKLIKQGRSDCNPQSSANVSVNAALDRLSQRLASELEKDNARFNRDKFLQACDAE